MMTRKELMNMSKRQLVDKVQLLSAKIGSDIRLREKMIDLEKKLTSKTTRKNAYMKKSKSLSKALKHLLKAYDDRL